MQTAHGLPKCIIAADFPPPEVPDNFFLYSPAESFEWLEQQDHVCIKSLDRLARHELKGLPVIVKLHDRLDVQGARMIAYHFPAFRKAGAWMADVKLSDIPKTNFSRAFWISAYLQCTFLTVSTASHIVGMRAAREGVSLAGRRTRVTAVGPLTSLNDANAATSCNRLYGLPQISASVHQLGLAYEAGVRTMVAGLTELPRIRQTSWSKDPDILLLIPGIRPRDMPVAYDDQKRTGTLEEVAASAGPLRWIPVIGRPIMEHPGFKSRREAVKHVLAEIDAVSSRKRTEERT